MPFRLLSLALLLCCSCAQAPAPVVPRLPNLVVVFADDLGYGDLGCYGARGWRTPHLDRLAREGMRFTDFYVAQPVCSASRAALLTGCYPNRIGITGALGPDARHGIASGETTLAEVLRVRGYATAAFGKWHLGHLPEFLPTRHGFDRFYGIPYSNDMWPLHPDLVALPAAERARKRGYPPLPLLSDEGVAMAEVGPEQQQRFTRDFTAHAVEFVRAHANEPFFVYLAHPMPHVPLSVAAGAEGRSGAGLLGDVIEEIDASVGQLLAVLDELSLAQDTLVVFTSDNGPWLSYGNHAGSTGGLREGKGTTWEGGVRVPFVARWPGHIPAGRVCGEPAMTIDLLPTVARLVNAPLPARPIDGRGLWPLLAGEPGARTPHEALFFYYNRNDLEAVRSGRWKLCLPHTYRTMAGQPAGRDGTPGPYRQERTPLALFDLSADPAESQDVAAGHPDVVARILALVAAMRSDLGDDLVKAAPTGAREPGRAGQ